LVVVRVVEFLVVLTLLVVVALAAQIEVSISFQ
jgi:hypothetical protein